MCNCWLMLFYHRSLKSLSDNSNLSIWHTVGAYRSLFLKIHIVSFLVWDMKSDNWLKSSCFRCYILRIRILFTPFWLDSSDSYLAKEGDGHVGVEVLISNSAWVASWKTGPPCLCSAGFLTPLQASAGTVLAGKSKIVSVLLLSWHPLTPPQHIFLYHPKGEWQEASVTVLWQ